MEGRGAVPAVYGIVALGGTVYIASQTHGTATDQLLEGTATWLGMIGALAVASSYASLRFRGQGHLSPSAIEDTEAGSPFDGVQLLGGLGICTAMVVVFVTAFEWLNGVGWDIGPPTVLVLLLGAVGGVGWVVARGLARVTSASEARARQHVFAFVGAALALVVAGTLLWAIVLFVAVVAPPEPGPV